METPQSMKETPQRTTADLSGGSDENIEGLDKNVLTEHVPDPMASCVGELRLRLLDDETFDIEVTKLGRLTPGRLERCWPQVVNRVAEMQSREAHRLRLVKEQESAS